MKKQWSKRQIIILSAGGVILLAVVLGLVLHLSKPSAIDEKLFEGAADKVEKDQERRGQYILQSIDIPQTRELYCESGNTAIRAANLVFEPCLWIEDTGEAAYGCAESITFKQNGRKAIVELAERKFSDGAVLEAADMISAYEMLCRPESAYPHKEKTRLIEGMGAYQDGTAEEISGMRALDGMHVEITFTEVGLEILDALSLPLYRESGDADGTISYVGTGSYAVDVLQPSVELRLIPNKYSGKKGLWETVIFQNMPLEIREKNLKEQTVDELALGAEQVSDIEELGYFTIYRKKRPVSSYLGFDLSSGDKLLRQAVISAVDRDAFAQASAQDVEIWKGLISDRITVKSDKNFAEKTYEKLLDSGSEGTIRILSSEDSESRGYTLLLQEQLEACGMKVEPVFVSGAEFQSMLSQRGLYDVYYIRNREFTNREVLKNMFDGSSEEYLEILIKQLEEDCRKTYDSLERYAAEEALFLTMEAPVEYRAVSADISESILE